MKRDMDLCRRILLELEKSDDVHGPRVLEIEGVDPQRVSYHVKLLDEAGLVEARDFSTMGEYSWAPSHVTWEGHEFLDAARSDTNWNAAKEKVQSATGSLTMEGLKVVLKRLIEAALG